MSGSLKEAGAAVGRGFRADAGARSKSSTSDSVPRACEKVLSRESSQGRHTNWLRDCRMPQARSMANSSMVCLQMRRHLLTRLE